MMEVAQNKAFEFYVDDCDEYNMTTSSSGCEVNSLDTSAEDMGCLIPRRLQFTSPAREAVSPEKNNNTMHTYSPPYNRVRALRLMDTPATPKTIIEKSSLPHSQLTPHPRFKFSRFSDKSLAVPTSYPAKPDKPAANLNPFTPDGMRLTSKKRTRSKLSLAESTPKSEMVESDGSDGELEQPTKKIALHESNITRYYQEFHEVCLIGIGEFGSVFKCINRLDGCTYAVKKSIKPVAGSVNEKTALNEVYAHAVLGNHPHVVRYYSAWAEDNHMIIQNEYCSGGSLADRIAENRLKGQVFSEARLRRLVLHVAEGLRYIHSMQLVHMDIKPGNIFISHEKRPVTLNYDSADDELEMEEAGDEVTYKVGDLGHVTCVSNPQVEEGDCRYLPSEILHEDFTHLPKADIFALGLTVLEAGGGGPFPKNGEEWHQLRSCHVPELTHISPELNELLKLMVHPLPELRPSASALLQHRALCPPGTKTKAQLQRELNAEKQKNQLLEKRLQNAEKCFKSLPATVLQNLKNCEDVRRLPTRACRLIGRKASRSHSATNL